MNKLILIYWGLFTLNLCASELTPVGIIQNALNRDVGTTFRADVELTTVSSVKTFTKNISIWVKKNSDSTHNTLIRFNSPNSVKGTKFLILEASNAETKRYIYLPTLKKERRIASDEDSAPILGTDVSYYDLGKRKTENFNHYLMKDTILNGLECYVVNSVPKEPSEDRLLRWITKKDFVILKSEQLSRDNKTIKRINAIDLGRIDGYLTISKLSVQNLQKNSTTTILLDNIKYNDPINDKMFTIMHLRNEK